MPGSKVVLFLENAKDNDSNQLALYFRKKHRDALLTQKCFFSQLSTVHFFSRDEGNVSLQIDGEKTERTEKITSTQTIIDEADWRKWWISILFRRTEWMRTWIIIRITFSLPNHSSKTGHRKKYVLLYSKLLFFVNWVEENFTKFLIFSFRKV